MFFPKLNNIAYWPSRAGGRQMYCCIVVVYAIRLSNIQHFHMETITVVSLLRLRLVTKQCVIMYPHSTRVRFSPGYSSMTPLTVTRGESHGGKQSPFSQTQSRKYTNNPVSAPWSMKTSLV